MLFMYLIGLIAYLLSFILSLLPDSTFLALPTAAWTAVGTVSGWFGWLIGLGGTQLKNTILTCIPIVMAIEIASLLWHIIRKWKTPFISKFIDSKS